jgi:hypothetical protein
MYRANSLSKHSKYSSSSTPVYKNLNAKQHVSFITFHVTFILQSHAQKFLLTHNCITHSRLAIVTKKAASRSYHTDMYEGQAILEIPRRIYYFSLYWIFGRSPGSRQNKNSILIQIYRFVIRQPVPVLERHGESSVKNTVCCLRAFSFNSAIRTKSNFLFLFSQCLFLTLDTSWQRWLSNTEDFLPGSLRNTLTDAIQSEAGMV